MKCGIGIRPELFDDVFDQMPEFGFLEAHSENYFGESIARSKLLEIREHYPVSLHGVGLSLGRADHLNKPHLEQLRSLVDEVDPLIVSEHLAWSAYSHRHVPDLLPLPLTEHSLAIMCQHIDQMQQHLGRQILVENPSNYLLFDQLQIPEPEFLNTLSERTGCGLLVDINNIHVSATNVSRDAKTYIDQLNSNAIGQFHLAGYTEVEREVAGVTEKVLIDTHNQTVYDPVWELFEYALNKHGARPTLFEWDSDFPEFSTLLKECDKANRYLQDHDGQALTVVPTDSSAKVIELNGVKQLAESQADFLDHVFNLDQALNTATQAHQHRIWIYQNNVYAATREYLEEVYPATRGVVGEGFFKQMAQRFIQTNPPSEGNIHLYGEDMVEMVSQFSALKEMPYLSPLMTMEWALHKAYFSQISDVLDPSSLDQELLLTMPVEFNDSVCIVESMFPIYEIHRQSLPDYQDEVSIDLDAANDIILIYKLGHVVEHRQLSKEEALFFQEIQKSENLLQAIDILSRSIEATTLSTTLSFMFDARLLRAIN